MNRGEKMIEQKDKVVCKRKDKTMHLAESFYTYNVVEPLLPYIGKTFITPNMVTSANIIFSLLMFYLGYKEHYILFALGIQFYLFLDILDGNLARYKNMRSKLGGTLDTICDNLFYNGMIIAIGINRVSYIYIIVTILLLNLYGIIATYYIVPRLRKLKVIKRSGIKKYFMDKGYIIGMDLGTLDIIMTFFLLLGHALVPMFITIIAGYIFDIIFRIVELKKNERLQQNKKVKLA